MRPILLLVACALVAPAFAAATDPCLSDGYPAAGIVEITGGSADSTAYLDDRGVTIGNGFYIYLESNGIWTPKLPGVYLGDPEHRDLQRGERWCNGVYSWPLCAFDECRDPQEYDVGPDYEQFSF